MQSPSAPAVVRPSARSTPPRVDVLGVEVSAIDLELALATIEEWIATGAREYVCVTGVHGVMESRRDPALRRIHNRAGMVTPDGMPLVWLARWAGFPSVTRVYGPDLMLAVCRASVARGYRHYFYGGAPGVAERLRDRLTARVPGLVSAGTYSPPFRPEGAPEEAAVLDAINATAPDIIWVGLSTPKQERWMDLHRARLTAPVLIGVGAAFDFHAGLKRQAPRWMQRSGLEWFFRLTQEPRRLWRRYSYNNTRFLLDLALSHFRRRSSPRP